MGPKTDIDCIFSLYAWLPEPFISRLSFQICHFTFGLSTWINSYTEMVVRINSRDSNNINRLLNTHKITSHAQRIWTTNAFIPKWATGRAIKYFWTHADLRLSIVIVWPSIVLYKIGTSLAQRIWTTNAFLPKWATGWAIRFSGTHTDLRLTIVMVWRSIVTMHNVMT